MSLTVAELRTLFTGDTSDLDRAQSKVRRDAARTGDEVARSYKQAGSQAGEGFAKGATDKVRAGRGRMAREGTQAGQEYGQAAGRSAGMSFEQRMRRTLIGFGIGSLAARAVKGAVGSAIEFDSTMRMVGVQTKQTGGDLKNLGDIALKMGADTKYSAQDAGDAMLELAKGGLSAAEIKAGALSTTLTLAAAGGLDLNNASTYVVQGLTTFGLAADEANRVAVALAGGANASTASVDSLGQALSQVGPGAKNAGLTLEETVGILSAFDNAGIKGSDAGTSLKTMLASLVPTTESAQNAMREYGLFVYDAANASRLLSDKGLKANARDYDQVHAAVGKYLVGQGVAKEGTDKLEDSIQRLLIAGGAMHSSFVNTDGTFKDAANMAGILQDKLGDLTEADRVAAMQRIFGSDAARAANVLTDLGTKGLEKYVKATHDKEAADKLAKTSMEGAAGAVENFQGAIETLGIKAGTQALPKLTKLANAGSDFISEMTDGTGAGGDFADALGDVADAAGDVLAIAGKIGDAWQALPDGMQGAILKAGVYGTAVGGALFTVKKIADVWGGVGQGANVLTRGRLGGTVGGLVGSTKPVPVIVMNPGFDGAGGKAAGSVGGVAKGAAGAAGSSAAGAAASGASVAAAAAVALLVAGFLSKRAANRNAERGTEANDALMAQMRKDSAVPAYGGSTGGYTGDPSPVRQRVEVDPVLETQKLHRQIAELDAAYDSLPKEVRTQIEIPGSNETIGVVTKLMEKYDLTPKQIETIFRTAGDSEAEARAKTLKVVLNSLPPEVRTAIKENGGKVTRDLLIKLQKKYDDLDGRDVLTLIRLKGASEVIGQANSLFATVARIFSRPIYVNTVSNSGGALNKPRPEPRMAVGGRVKGPGGPRDDMVPAWLSNGEYVMPADRVQALGVGFFDGLRAGRYADGGLVGSGGASAGGGMTAVDWTRMTQAWFEAAQSSMKVAKNSKAATAANLSNLQAQARVADIIRQLRARDEKGRPEVWGLDRKVLQAELKQAIADRKDARFSESARDLRDRVMSGAGLFGTGATTASQALRNMGMDGVSNAQFGGVLAQLKAGGLNKQLLDQFIKEGPSAQAIALGKSILAGGAATIGQFNESQSQLGLQAKQLGALADGKRLKGGSLVNIEKFIAQGLSPSEVASSLYYKLRVDL